MVVLYEHPLSPYVHKVKIALTEKGVAFEPRLPDFVGGQDAAFAGASPRLEVPALVDGDTTVFDSTIILEYIEERWPRPALHPAAPGATPPPPGSRLARWPDRVRARPSVATTFQAATESMAGFEMIPQLIASGIFKRQYRDHRLEWMVRSGGLDIVLAGLRQNNIRFTTEPQ